MDGQTPWISTNPGSTLVIHRLGRHIGGNIVAYIALAVAVVGSGGSYAVAATAHHSSRKRPTSIAACVNDRTGELTLDRSKRCSRGHRKVTWSIKGPKGATGAAGAPAPSIYAAVDAAATAVGAQPIVEKGLTVQQTGVGLYQVTVTDPSCAMGYNIPEVTARDYSDSVETVEDPHVAYLVGAADPTQFIVQTGFLSGGTFTAESDDFNVLDTCLPSGRRTDTR